MSSRQFSLASCQHASRLHCHRKRITWWPFFGTKSCYVHTTCNSSSVTVEERPERYRRGGYHPVYLGETFNNKYEIISKLGYGVYSTVWLAKDLTSQSPHHVALKILTADSYGCSKPVYELDILKHISQTDPSHPGYKHVVHLLDNFIHEGPNGKHLCLVLEVMRQNVYNLQQSFPNKQLPVHIGRQITKKILHALDWLHDSCGIIHTDIKPDNILIEIPNVNEAVQKHLNQMKHSNSGQLEDSGLTSRSIATDVVTETSKINIRITDFGVASWKDDQLTELIQPPSLRAPEVFLGAPWDSSVDIWGFACVIYELLQGRVLFRGRPGPKDAWTAEEDQLAQMIELLGPIPVSVRKRGKRSNKFFDEEGNLLHIKQLYPYSLRDLLAQTTNTSISKEDYEKFEAFLRAMLQYEPRDRKTPKELLEEPWL
ncbi:kinase-like domain-containing protein [Pyrenochaeta sp. MPI-SDFR-AT-0127]|nr:kinase-like domain-containing protein [Pyrenochaeta sp. MPI-SDFR-AT-0127]